MHVRFVGFVCLCKEKEESSREEAKKNIYKPYQEFDPFEKHQRLQQVMEVAMKVRCEGGGMLNV